MSSPNLSSQNRLIFVGITPYPNGVASTNRLVTLLSELPNYNWAVDVFIMASTKYPTSVMGGRYAFDRKGIYKNVHFRYTSMFVKASRFLLLRIISGFWGIFTLPFLLLPKVISNNQNQKIILLTNLTQGHYVIYLKLISSLISAKFVLARSEYPSVIRKKSLLTKPYQKLFENWIFKLFDGFALMTHTLGDYFRPLGGKKSKFELIPMTVDIQRFSNVYESPFNFIYIAYAGSLSNEKDGVDILLKSFNKIAKEFPDIHLVIIGDTTKSVFYKKLLYINEIDGADFKNRIHFTGRIDASLIPKYLTNAFILALARPDSKQSQGGFPTKLGEYLATGKPVIVTKVGEIPNYLIDKKSAILCEPGSIDDFSNKLDWALKNESVLKEIGEAGKEVALEVFNSEVQGKRFNDFLLELKNI